MNDNVLIVDDNEINLKLLEKVITTHTKHNVILAKNGKEAIDFAIEHKPFLILMDIMMPEIDGFKATATIKEIPGLQDVPIIAITAVHTKEGIRDVFECGCEDILPKPFEISIVVEIVNKYWKKVQSQSQK